MRKNLTFLFFLLLTQHVLVGQNRATISLSDTLNNIGKVLINSRDIEDKILKSNHLYQLLDSVLKQPESFAYSFDSVPVLTVFVSQNKLFKVFNWSYAIEDGMYNYAGIIQVFNKKNKTIELYNLTDSSKTLINPDKKTTSNTNWRGCHYYKMIEKKYNKVIYYTLLGWDGNNATSNKKLIDVLTFDENRKPILGAPIFNLGDKKPILNRIIFEYAEAAPFTLRFEKQNTPEGKLKEMIVFDRLMPISENLKGQAAFYVPTTNIIDGFIFEKGEWVLTRDIDARSEKKKIKKRKIELNLAP